MYLILSILLGCLTGSFFYSRMSKERRASPKYVISAVLMGLAAGTAYVVTNTYSLCTAISVCITLMLLGFEAISDLRSYETYTMPIYICAAVIAVIKTVFYVRHGMMWQWIAVCEFVIFFAVACYCLSVLNGKRIVYGDFDIYFIIFLTAPYYAAVLLISSVVLFIKHSLKKKRPYIAEVKENESNKSSIAEFLETDVPFVPLLLIGYIISTLMGGVF